MPETRRVDPLLSRYFSAFLAATEIFRSHRHDDRRLSGTHAQFATAMLACGLQQGLQACVCTSLLPQAVRLAAWLQHGRRGATTADAAPGTVASDATAYASAAPMATIHINGHTVSVPEGTSILTAATQLGIHVRTSPPPAAATPLHRPSHPRCTPARRSPPCAPTRACPPPRAPAACAWLRLQAAR